MIYTCTLNPSLDYFIECETLEPGMINRIQESKKMPGGKGINVSRVLRRLGHESKALGFIGGFTGDFIESALKNEGISSDFVRVNGDTRINIKIKADRETEINGDSPEIYDFQVENFFQCLDVLKSGDILVLSGSIPASLETTIYRDIIQRLEGKDVRCVVDTTGEVLTTTFSHHPFLIKPNHTELGELFSVDIKTPEEAVPYAQELVNRGVQQVIVSMAGMGALYVSEKLTLKATVPQGEVRNSVGAGDSLVGGFIAKLTESENPEQAFEYSVAAGSATAFSIDLCKKTDVDALAKEIKISRL